MDSQFIEHFIGILGASTDSRKAILACCDAQLCTALQATKSFELHTTSTIPNCEGLAESEAFEGVIVGKFAESLDDLLKSTRQYLRERGVVAVHIPNRNWHVRITSGISGPMLDHLPTFSHSEIEFAAYRQGFRILSMSRSYGRGYVEWIRAGQPLILDFGKIVIRCDSVAEAETYFVESFWGICQLAQAALAAPLAVILDCHEARRHELINCIEALLADTWFSFKFALLGGSDDKFESTSGLLDSCNAEFVFVNSISELQTWLKQPQNFRPVLIIDGRYRLSLGSLSILIDALHHRATNCAILARSNTTAVLKSIDRTNSLLEIDEFGWQFRSDARLSEINSGDPTALIVKHEILVTAVSYARSPSIEGLFEQLLHHHTPNGRLLMAHAAYAEQERIVFERPLSGIPAPTLSLCMIVRDNETTIRRCLASISPWVDEIVMVDTGSTDATMEICKEFGVRLFEFPWCDDFSAARNESLKHARGEWILWMDSDDVIPQEQAQRLRQLVDCVHTNNCLGYVLQVHCPSEESAQLTIVDHVKLFRNRSSIRFEHRIHEQILPSIRAAGGEVKFTDIYLIHEGSIQTAAVRARKLERDLRILALDLESRPDHPFILFNLGMTHEHAGNFSEAIKYLMRCLELSSPAESHVRKAWAILVSCWQRQGAPAQAARTAVDGLNVFADDPELLFRRAVAYQSLNEYEKAITDYKKLLTIRLAETFRSVDPTIQGCKAFHNLAGCYQSLGDHETALVWYLRAIEQSPCLDASWIATIELLLSNNDVGKIANLAQNGQSNKYLLMSTRVRLRAVVAELSGNTDQADSLLAEMVKNEARDASGVLFHCKMLNRMGSELREERVLDLLASLGCKEIEDRLALRNRVSHR